MKTTTSIILTIHLLTSCTVNLYRPNDPTAVDLDKVELKLLNSSGALSDTVLTLRKSDCQIKSDDYFIAVYKIQGETKSRAFTSYGNYPKEPTLDNFNWAKIIDSVDSIKNQTPELSYYGTIVEGDTTWHQSGMIGDQVWTFKLYTKTDTTTWETDYTEIRANPSMAKTIISEYILSETYNKIWGMTELYGERNYKKKPLLGRK